MRYGKPLRRYRNFRRRPSEICLILPADSRKLEEVALKSPLPPDVPRPGGERHKAR